MIAGKGRNVRIPSLQASAACLVSSLTSYSRVFSNVMVVSWNDAVRFVWLPIMWYVNLFVPMVRAWLLPMSFTPSPCGGGLTALPKPFAGFEGPSRWEERGKEGRRGWEKNTLLPKYFLLSLCHVALNLSLSLWNLRILSSVLTV